MYNPLIYKSQNATFAKSGVILLKSIEMSEAQTQEAIIDYCDYRHYPCFHIPNGGSRNKAEAKRLKRQGVRAGVPDLFFPVSKRGCHGLFIELKVGRNKATEKQLEWIDLLNVQGYKAIVCVGYEQAKETIDWYFADES